VPPELTATTRTQCRAFSSSWVSKVASASRSALAASDLDGVAGLMLLASQKIASVSASPGSSSPDSVRNGADRVQPMHSIPSPDRARSSCPPMNPDAPITAALWRVAHVVFLS
jgi:hypothetical protein